MQKGCRKKHTRQSRKVLWLILSSPFFKEICKNGTRYGRRNGAKFSESKSLPTSTTNLQFNIFFYINNKIRPTSTINIIINIRNMPNSTTRENQHQQKFLFSSTTICLTTNIEHRLQQQNTFNNLGTNDWLWWREVGTQKF